MHDRQSSGYRMLGDSDKQPDASHFAEFILGALLETVKISNASDSVSDPVAKLVGIFKPDDELSIQTMMERLQLRHRTYFRRTFLTPTLAAGRLVMTQPDSSRSPTQRYRLTPSLSPLVAEN